MKANNIQQSLRDASESVRRAVDATDRSEVKNRLTGIEEQLRYFVEGDPRDPEATVTPRPDTLDTIQSSITEEMDRGDDEVTEHLREARRHLLLTIVTLDERRRKQYEFFPEPNENR